MIVERRVSLADRNVSFCLKVGCFSILATVSQELRTGPHPEPADVSLGLHTSFSHRPF
jgi:hypothetical protein